MPFIIDQSNLSKPQPIRGIANFLTPYFTIKLHSFLMAAVKLLYDGLLLLYSSVIKLNNKLIFVLQICYCANIWSSVHQFSNSTKIFLNHN